MRGVRGTLMLFVLAIFVALANVALVENPAERNVELMPEMLTSVPYDAFSENPNFANGQTLQHPVEGTIARGLLPLHYAATPEEAIRAGEELVSPIAVDDVVAMARGKFVFEQYCLVCHGPEGKGDGTVALRGFPTPPSFHAENALKLKDGKMFHILTYGQANMPSYASQVDRDDRWKVIRYVRDLQEKGLAPPLGPAPAGEAVPPVVDGTLVPGEEMAAPEGDPAIPESGEPVTADTAAIDEGIR